MSGDSDQLGTGVGCVIRPSSEMETLSKSQLEFSNVDVSAIRYPVGDFEEIASTLICLKPTSGRDVEFQVIWILLANARKCLFSPRKFAVGKKNYTSNLVTKRVFLRSFLTVK